MRAAYTRLWCERGQTAAEYLGILLVVAAIIAVVASSGIERMIVAQVQQAICEVGGDNDGDCEAREQRDGEQADDEPASVASQPPPAPPLDLSQARRVATPAAQPAVFVRTADRAPGGATTNCFASTAGDCAAPDGPPGGAYLTPEPSPSPGNEAWDAIVDGAAELSGYNDADDAVESFGEGQIASGLLSGLLASPFGKIPKAGEKALDGLRGLFRRSGKEEPARARGDVEWVDENAAMSEKARRYEDGADGARSNPRTRQGQAPELRVRRDGEDRAVRFDGFDTRDNALIDRKRAVAATDKAKRQARRQSEALRQNGYRGRWELPSDASARRAQRLLERWEIDNIDVRVVPE